MSRPRLFLILILALTTLPPIISARKWSPTDLPNPQHPATSTICNRPVKSVVCDPDSYLTSHQAARLDGVANLLYSSLKGLHPPLCPDDNQAGPQLAVVVVNSITPSTEATAPSDNAFLFARKLHDLWGVGHPSCQNGVVIVFAISDRAFAISVGSGLKSVFPDSNVNLVQDIIRDKMRAADYGEAIVDAAVAVASLVGGNMLSPTSSSQRQYGELFQFLLIFFAFLAMTAFSFYKKHRQQSRYERCRRTLDAMDRDRVRAGANQYVATSCPICLEDFEGRETKPASTTSASSTSSLKISNESDSPNEDEVQPLNEEVEKKTEESVKLPESAPVNTEKKSNADPKSKSLMLRCGHEFHESCIATWLTGSGRSNTTCPICRKPIDGSSDSSNEGGSSSNNNGAASSGVHNVGGGLGGWGLYEPELRFRMRRARFYYPDFITARMMNDWENDRYDTRCRMATHSALRGANPAAVARAARAAGNHGSTFSFGGSGGAGGSSRGGGGGGGGW